MAKVDKSAARLYKVLAEKFGKLIHDAPNEDVRAKLRKCNSYGSYAKAVLEGKDIPDIVASRMYELINRCINEWSDQYVASFYDALIQDDSEKNQLSLDLDSKPEEVVESSDEMLEFDFNGVKHTVKAVSKMKKFITIMRPDGSCYDQEVADDFDLKEFESKLSQGYFVIHH